MYTHLYKVTEWNEDPRSKTTSNLILIEIFNIPVKNVIIYS